jgi:hypothetical protein
VSHTHRNGQSSAKHWMREIMDFFGEITDP